MKKEKRIIMAVALLLATALIAGNNLLNRPLTYDPESAQGYQTVFTRPTDVGEELPYADTMQTVGESGNLKLSYNTYLHQIELQNTVSGYIWKSACEDTALKQLCTVTLINTESDNTLAINNVESECQIESRTLENGVSLKMFFPGQGVGFTFKLWLEKGRLWALIPIDSLVETDIFSVLSIDMLPYFGAAPAEENGYIMFPDGSGALYDFSQKTIATSPVTVDVFSDRVTDVDKLLDAQSTGVHSVRIPAYGIRRGTDSFIAYIADGSASSAVTLEPAGYICNFNRIYGSGIYRKVTEVISDSGISSYQSDGRLGTGDFSICYQLLSGEGSDYAGMAAAVRTLLQEYELLPEANTDIGLKLDVVMGAKEKTMVGDTYRTVTTLSQLSEMFTKLPASNQRISAVLLGWQKQGYGSYPDTGKAASSIGSFSGFDTPDNVDLYLDYHAILADKGNDGATLRRDGIRNSKRVTIIGQASETYILNANTQLSIFEKLLPDLNFSGKYGLSVSGAGSILYDDYNTHCGMTRQQTANSLSALLDKAGKESPLMVNEPNVYALKYADFVSGLYQNSSGYHILGRSVPFYQLVISGCVPYSLDIAGNLSSDFRVTRLRWAEYGAVPYFIVSSADSAALSETKADIFFAISFEEQLARISETVTEFDSLRTKLKGSRLCGHSEAAPNVYRSDFENGASVFVNYTDKEVSVQGVTVPAMDYVVQEVGA